MDSSMDPLKDITKRLDQIGKQGFGLAKSKLKETFSGSKTSYLDEVKTENNRRIAKEERKIFNGVFDGLEDSLSNTSVPYAVAAMRASNFDATKYAPELIKLFDETEVSELVYSACGASNARTMISTMLDRVTSMDFARDMLKGLPVPERYNPIKNIDKLKSEFDKVAENALETHPKYEQALAEYGENKGIKSYDIVRDEAAQAKAIKKAYGSIDAYKKAVADPLKEIAKATGNLARMLDMVPKDFAVKMIKENAALADEKIDTYKDKAKNVMDTSKIPNFQELAADRQNQYFLEHAVESGINYSKDFLKFTSEYCGKLGKHYEAKAAAYTRKC